jgi:transcriptional regulator
MLQGIVGVELAIAEIQCKFKLSQNRSKADQLSAVEALSKENSGALADAMASENR